jgi:hypothetical protein
MVNISSDLSTALKQDVVTERDYIIIDGARLYLWFDLYDDCYKDGNIVQNFIMKRIEFEYADSYEFKEKEFKAYKEFQLPDLSWESICYGTFIVTEVNESDTKESVSVVAYDYGLSFANPYLSVLDYTSGTVTMLDVLQEVCTACSVTLATTTFPNSDFIVDSNQFDGAPTFGNVVSAVAGMAGSFAKIRGDDQLYLIFTNETGITISPSEYSEFEDKRDTHYITIISLGVTNIEGESIEQRDEAGILLYGENYLVINDNPFAYAQSKRESLITAIYNQCIGFGYSSMVLKSCLYPQLECGDKITVINKAGESVETIILRITYNGAEITLEAPSIIDATVEYSNPLSLSQSLKLTEIKVDKQEQTITSTIELTQSIQNDISNNYVTTQNLSNIIEQTVTSTSNSISATGGFNLLKNTQFYLDGEEWNISVGAIYTVSQSAEVQENTASKSELTLTDGTFSQIFQTELNKIYTISGKYKHTANSTNASGVRIYTSPTEYTDVLLITTDVTDRTDFSYTYTATVNNPTVQIHSDDSDFYLSDLIIQNGESKVWTPNAQETRGINYVLNQNGQRLYNISNTDFYTQTDSNSFDVYNDETLLSTYGETFDAESGSLNSSLTINDLVFQHVSGNLYFLG